MSEGKLDLVQHVRFQNNKTVNTLIINKQGFVDGTFTTPHHIDIYAYCMDY